MLEFMRSTGSVSNMAKENIRWYVTSNNTQNNHLGPTPRSDTGSSQMSVPTPTEYTTNFTNPLLNNHATVHKHPSGHPLRNATESELLYWRQYVSGTSPYFCRASCCWRFEPTTWPYGGGYPHNVTKQDLVSIASIKYLGDIVYNLGYPDPPGFDSYDKFNPKMVDCLQPATVIFVITAYLGEFFTTILPQIKSHFILVSGDGDESAPNKFVSYLSDPKILLWMANNCDLTARNQSKLYCLPIGVSPWGGKVEGVLEQLNAGVGLIQGIYPSKHHPKDQPGQKLLLAAFARHPVRQALWDMACRIDGILRNVSTCSADLGQEPLPQPITLQQTAKHAFVLAPPGLGVDTFR